jgi:hypothetical protein
MTMDDSADKRLDNCLLLAAGWKYALRHALCALFHVTVLDYTPAIECFDKESLDVVT